ncbi:MAG: hypothetical protein ACK53L_08775, partial [Pirellulaceae bacterium]
SGVSQIFSTNSSFAALKADGSVVTWGDPNYGGDSSAVARLLSSGVAQIFSTGSAFAALKADGSVVTWGDPATGGDSNALGGLLSSDVTQVFSTYYAFAALKVDGSVVTWGDPSNGGDSDAVSGLLTNVVAFADVFTDDRLVNEAPTALSLANAVRFLVENTPTTSRIKVADISISDDALGSKTITLAGDDAASFEVIGSELFLKAGIALDFETKTTYAVTVSASDPTLPGSTPVSADFSVAVAKQLASVITSPIAASTPGRTHGEFSNFFAFAVLRPDGSVVTWGDPSYGGDSSAVASLLSSGVTQVFSTRSAFAALKADGSVVTWGDSSYGGDSTP